MKEKKELTLFDLTQQRMELQNKLLALNFDDETIQDTLDGESSAIAKKIEDYGHVIKNMELFAGAIKTEEDRIIARRKSVEKQVENIKEWLLKNMEACSINKIECPLFTISLHDNPGKVHIFDEKLIPDEYLKVADLPPPAPDKSTILRELKEGKEISGCRLEKTKRISIK